ncbi:unnamed protein product [Cyprideis torosa]|uniref:Uncharacterized protein n=1 Tax=Cyprideis torosa TaxID=163714 RepID=A0A7R8ZIU4_9CRUS|nr:unnamed protein product [Cyprideis torosa]CAG0880776.1 unnamed protein product [Cyprideis torosa]
MLLKLGNTLMVLEIQLGSEDLSPQFRREVPSHPAGHWPPPCSLTHQRPTRSATSSVTTTQQTVIQRVCLEPSSTTQQTGIEPTVKPALTSMGGTGTRASAGGGTVRSYGRKRGGTTTGSQMYGKAGCYDDLEMRACFWSALNCYNNISAALKVLELALLIPILVLFRYHHGHRPIGSEDAVAICYGTYIFTFIILIITHAVILRDVSWDFSARQAADLMTDAGRSVNWAMDKP